MCLLPGFRLRASGLQKTVLTSDHYVSENPVTNGFAPVEPPPEMPPTEEAELNRPLEGTPEVWPPRGSYEPVSGPMERPPMDGDMCDVYLDYTYYINILEDAYGC